MDIDDLTDEQLDQLAADLAPRFPTGTHGDRVVLTKRQFIGAATGVLSAGALMALGVDEASAQAAGQVGTSSNPVDVEAYDIQVANLLNGGGPLSDGDGTERQIWIIANGASDPSGADASDIIFEEEA